jgi:predicted DNA-binding transcriptional regulator YafY
LFIMARNFARHEQFLRIFALLELLSKGRAPIDDRSLISMLKERLGLSTLSSRTLHRDCDFLTSCGYPISHVPIQGDRKFGWQLSQDGAAKRMPTEPLTLLELVAFSLGRDLLRMFEGTVSWTGIESLRQKLERDLPPALLDQLVESKDVFHVEPLDLSRYAQRPRLISTLSNAIVERREIEIVSRGADGTVGERRTLQPLRLVVRPPAVRLLSYLSAKGGEAEPLLVDIDRIEQVTPLDSTFTADAIDPHDVLRRCGKHA